MKSNLILLFSFLLTLSACSKSSDDPEPSTSIQSSNFSNATVKINNSNSEIDSAFVVVSNKLTQINISNGALEVGKISMVSINLFESNITVDKEYKVPNKADDLNNFNNFSYTKANGSAIGDIYNNSSCDSLFQTSNSDYGDYGTVTITKFDSTNKIISGTFKMTLCGSNIDGYVSIEGSFIDVNYL